MAVTSRVWGQTEQGSQSQLFTLENEQLVVKVSDLGASLVSLYAPDRDGTRQNVVVGGEEFSTYLPNSNYLGATVGRFANRIARGRFQLNGKEYELLVNNGPNHLHGGSRGLTHRQWDSEATNDSVRFSTVSPDSEDGYPGTLHVSVVYVLNGNTLRIEYSAECDAPTVLNLTNHTYWNLAGGGTVLKHELQLNADEFLENDADVLPTGRILPVAQSPYDFREPHAIGDMIDQTAGGYDNCFVIRGWNESLHLAGVATDPVSGRSMSVLTTEPGVQLYTANHFNGSAATAGAGRHEAFCLECQHFPDSPNQPEFPSTLLLPGQKYQQITEHRFEVAASTR